MRCFVTIDDGTTVGDEFEADVTYKNNKLTVKPDKAGAQHYYGYFDSIDKTSIHFIGSTGVGDITKLLILTPVEEKDKPPKSPLSRTLQGLIDAIRALLGSIVFNKNKKETKDD